MSRRTARGEHAPRASGSSSQGVALTPALRRGRSSGAMPGQCPRSPLLANWTAPTRPDKPRYPPRATRAVGPVLVLGRYPLTIPPIAVIRRAGALSETSPRLSLAGSLGSTSPAVDTPAGLGSIGPAPPGDPGLASHGRPGLSGGPVGTVPPRVVADSNGIHMVAGGTDARRGA